MTEIVLVLTTVPTAELGELIAQTLVAERLAACVTILPAMTSFYRWQEQVERATEYQLTIKTMRDRVDVVEARIRTLHSYELPELLVIAADDGSEAYLAWVMAGTRAQD
jgi:periplasmic divalent cation tolerance protein